MGIISARLIFKKDSYGIGFVYCLQILRSKVTKFFNELITPSHVNYVGLTNSGRDRFIIFLDRLSHLLSDIANIKGITTLGCPDVLFEIEIHNQRIIIQMPFINEKVFLPYDQKYIEVDIFHPNFDDWGFGNSLYMFDEEPEIITKICKKEFLFK